MQLEDSSPQFIYEPIGSDSIRLFRIAKSPEGELYGDLRAYSIGGEACPTYLALSYVWGSGDYSNSITLNGQRMPVLQNVWTFLQEACRLQSQEALWWIDSVAIDQKNAEERSAQVQLMGSIYQKAYGTIIWLGESSEGSDVAVEFLHFLRSRVGKLRTDQEEVRQVRAERYPQWRAVERFLARSWWNRCWTLQEFIISPRVTFSCGESSIGRSDLMEAMYAIWLCNAHDGRLMSREAYDAAWNRRRILQWYRKYHQLSLVATMEYCAFHEASDPRDRIYSLLGLASSKDRHLVKPDYNSDVVLIYSRLVQAFVRKYSSLDIICMAHLFNRYASSSYRSDTGPTPSWVPDWRKTQISPAVVPLLVSQSARSDIGNLRPLHALRSSAVYEASGSLDPETFFSQDLRELICKGTILDIVDGIGGLKEYEDRCNSGLDFSTTDGHECVQSTSVRNLSAAEGDQSWSIIETIARCLVLDRKDRYLCHQAPESFAADFYVFCKAAVQQPSSVEPMFIDWFERNRSLVIHGMSLEKHLEDSWPYSKWQYVTQRAVPNFKDTSDWESFLSRFRNTTAQMARRLIVTERGLLGMAPCGTVKGDMIAVFFGCSVPAVLRRLHGSEAFEFIGECYVHGYMNGEILKDLDSGQRTVESFQLW